MCRTEVATRPTVAGREDPDGVERDASTSAASFRVREYEARDEDGIYALEHKSQMENPISRFVARRLLLLQMPVLRVWGGAWPAKQANSSAEERCPQGAKNDILALPLDGRV
jgi:hypothetical protein